MGKVLTRDGKIKIGTYTFPDRAKPCLCVEQGNTITVYGTFNNKASADEFMDALADLTHAIKEV